MGIFSNEDIENFDINNPNIEQRNGSPNSIFSSAISQYLNVNNDDRVQPDFSEDKKRPAFIIIQKNKGSRKGEFVAVTNKFILTQMQKTKAERFQINETFGEPVLYFFDEKTKIYSFTGVLFDSDSQGSRDSTYYQWAESFNTFWDQHLRGTALTDNDNIATLIVDNTMLFGFPTGLTMLSHAQSMHTQNFSFSMIVTDHVSLLKDPEQSYSGYDINFKAKLSDIASQLETVNNEIKELEGKLNNAETLTAVMINNNDILLLNAINTRKALIEEQANLLWNQRKAWNK